MSEAPTILTEVTESDPVMQKDIFGPVLPVLTVSSLDDAIAFINKQDKPLCVYAYSCDSKVPERHKITQKAAFAVMFLDQVVAYVTGHPKTHVGDLEWELLLQ